MKKERPPESKEVVFRSWIGPFADGWGPSRKAMGDEVDNAFRKFTHYKFSEGHNPEEAAKKSQEGAEEFQRLTGYSAEDFLTFMDNLPPPSKEAK